MRQCRHLNTHHCQREQQSQRTDDLIGLAGVATVMTSGCGGRDVQYYMFHHGHRTLLHHVRVSGGHIILTYTESCKESCKESCNESSENAT